MTNLGQNLKMISLLNKALSVSMYCLLTTLGPSSYMRMRLDKLINKKLQRSLA